ncbi:universal stress protein [Arthrobacter sp. SLBN-53]|uniref:universal stress protein n=1 Tax=Arthrobacter sp. SLBN-53 TaxID=2768412 RepID=UPI00114D9F24|nr:universal stress protein [Arthrobacter sp. SLBN-53]TQK30761.1 nucleotide-binding universal stress UspA family protein [Arthrobacter sp. SLBN-53]
MSDRTAPIVVGVDGTSAALHAVRWAGALAEKLAAPLQIVHAGPHIGHQFSDAVGALVATGAHAAREASPQILAAAEEAVRQVHPHVDITTTSLDEPVEDALKKLSRHARIIVVGCDELTPGAALLVGSLTLNLCGHTRCPVVAWRGESLIPNTKPIVVGVDGSSDTVLDLAFELAAVLHAPVQAVHAWSMRVSAGDSALPFLIDWAAIELEQVKTLNRTVEPYCRSHPDVAVDVLVDAASPRRALLRQLSDAQMVIVGSRGRGALAATVLGSTSLNLLHHSPVPVVVCPAASDAD